MPNAIENLSNALQTIQDFLKNPASIVEAAAAAAAAVAAATSTTSTSNESKSEATTPTNLLSKLSSLSTVLLGVSSSSTTSNQSESLVCFIDNFKLRLRENLDGWNNFGLILRSKEAPKLAKKPSESSLKRQKSAPDYKPTPINELKKLKHQEENESRQNYQPEDFTDYQPETPSSSKRKMPAGSGGVTPPPAVHASKSDETLLSQRRDDSSSGLHATESSDDSSSGKKTTITATGIHRSGAGSEEKPKRLKTSEEDQSNGGSSKKASCDLVTFSKLTLSQQVLKRYEMLNKPVPTPNQLVEAKLKKKSGEPSGSAKGGDKQAVNPNSPLMKHP